MLPDFGALDLRPREAPTGEFATLSREQADELNDSREVEPISHEEFVPSADLPPGSEYFRVRNKFQKADHTYDYKYYDADTLWEWVKTMRTVPHSRLPIWREDWMDLMQRFDPGMAVPTAVTRLPSLTDQIRVYEGTLHRRHVRTEFPSGQATYYDGPAGHERRIRIEWQNGEKRFYEGDKGEERKVCSSWSNGEKRFFMGPQGQEAKVRTEWPNGEVHFFTGLQGQEAKVRVKRPNGTTTYYDGPAGQERRIAIWLANGEKNFYEGPQGQEHMVRTQWVDNEGFFRAKFFDGPKGEERMVYSLGTKGEQMVLTSWVGPKGSERKLFSFEGTHNMDVNILEWSASETGALRRKLYNNGEVRFYDGSPDQPLLRRVVTPWGSVRFYTGDEPNHETLVRVVTPEGEVQEHIS
tara:strand:+ start:1908 stop:3137 length:1230 start_codon:yes stop_codon:yes gene_type:complete